MNKQDAFMQLKIWKSFIYASLYVVLGLLPLCFCQMKLKEFMNVVWIWC